jgi:hypothetical protein
MHTTRRPFLIESVWPPSWGIGDLWLATRGGKVRFYLDTTLPKRLVMALEWGTLQWDLMHRELMKVLKLLLWVADHYVVVRRGRRRGERRGGRRRGRAIH